MWFILQFLLDYSAIIISNAINYIFFSICLSFYGWIYTLIAWFVCLQRYNNWRSKMIVFYLCYVILCYMMVIFYICWIRRVNESITNGRNIIRTSYRDKVLKFYQIINHENVIENKRASERSQSFVRQVIVYILFCVLHYDFRRRPKRLLLTISKWVANQIAGNFNYVIM